MIFTPYSDESEVISRIQKLRGEDYALIRMTFTMIDKNNLDANGILRDLLLQYGFVDYETLEHGGSHGVSHNALFIQTEKNETVKLNFYRVTNARGDRRFSIEKLKNKMLQREINEGDLLYISAYRNSEGNPILYFVNLTHNTPSDIALLAAIGMDRITTLFHQLKPTLREIVRGGFYDNSKGAGPLAPKDVGDTLERLLGIQTNNRRDADYEGFIEIKAKGGSRTLDTLFTLRPRFDGTPVAVYEPDDRKRVSAFARLYGYDSDAHPGCKSLYVTIGSADAPQNNQGFHLYVDDDQRTVDMIWTDPATGRKERTAFWTFAELKDQLMKKHPATLWVQAESRDHNGIVQFRYTKVEFSKSPQFSTFLSLIKKGMITYDWRGYTSREGQYTGKNHGNAWRIRPNARAVLFGEMETLDL